MIYKEIILGETTDQGPVSLGRRIMHRFKKVLAGPGRFFTKLTKGGEYLRIQNHMLLTGDFDIKFKATVPKTGGHLFSNIFDDKNRILISSSGSVLFEFDNDVRYMSTFMKQYLGDNKLHDFHIERRANYIDFYMDGKKRFANLYARKNFYFNSVGAKFAGATSTPHWEGVIADLTIQRSDGTVILDCPLDGGPEAIVETNIVDPANSIERVGVNTSQVEQYSLIGDFWSNQSGSEQFQDTPK